MSTIVPGENVDAQHINLKLGPGLLNVMSNGPSGSANYIIATRAGNLNHSANGAKWWIESNSRRVPTQESVIGVIFQRQGEGYRVDIGSAHMASLDGLAFEGATKRNRPNLRVSFIVSIEILV
ncbi:exosome non-catalytic core subunit rrp40 [Leucoagaricus gongylophorus]